MKALPTLLALAALLTLPLLRAAEPAISFPIPPASNILSTLHPSHPRLLATSKDFENLRQRTASDPQLKEWLRSLRQRADRVLTEPPSKYEIPDGLRLLSVSRRVLDRVYLLALLDQLEPNPRYVDRAWKELEAAANFQDWNPRHFLDTAEMTHAFAIGYDWLYHRWTPGQRQALRAAMVDKGIRIALEGYDRKNSFCWWTTSRHNWNQVCNGGIGMGALALADLEPALASDFLHRSLQSLQLAMREFAPDGAWEEGPGYWNYATDYNTTFLAALQSALGTDFQLSTFPGFADTGLFPICLLGPTGRTFNYADGGDSRIRAPQLFWMANRFNRPAYAAYQRQYASPSPLDLLWYRPTPDQIAPPSPPLDRHFRRAEIVTLRSHWNDTNALFLGFKGGDNAANHSHLDLGTFVLDALGVRWGLDLGADNYNLPGFFGAQRWTYYRLRAEGHNTLVLNPGLDPDQDPKAKAAILQFLPDTTSPSATIDLTAAHGNRAREVHRTFTLQDRRRAVVTDRLVADHPVDLWWFFHTKAEVDVASNEGVALLRADGKEMTVRILEPSGARFVRLPAAPLPSTPHPATQNPNDGIRKLAVHLPGVTNTTLTVRFEPR